MAAPANNFGGEVVIRMSDRWRARAAWGSPRRYKNIAKEKDSGGYYGAMVALGKGDEPRTMPPQKIRP